MGIESIFILYPIYISAILSIVFFVIGKKNKNKKLFYSLGSIAALATLFFLFALLGVQNPN
ncbi:hypothetical protein HOD88_01470 [archaeon]|jgi:hypothetical protein|nr:hypothetical protein [archaeon]